MADTFLKPNYNPTEGERLHRQAMELGSAALRARLVQQHPAIVAHLIARQKEQAR